ncbi:MAG: hypothetical protein EOO26_09220 [Comamonadaceae bacterium]|nr:MAG: hypothetical protein EOO26_09220 [Comamonadaceae bacterium]
MPAQALSRTPRPLTLLSALAATAVLVGCSLFPPPREDDRPVARRVEALLPVDALLLGEQHDAQDHHKLELEAVEALVARDQLAALAIEMAEEGRSTDKLGPKATEAQVQAALEWNDRAWGWKDYGPAVMAAVRAGVPVVGANLPLARIKTAMADVSLDAQLNDSARATQQEAVRSGHCNLLPESQIVPMTRVQIARDRSMAQAVVKAKQPGKTVLLIAGAGHATKLLGVPQQMPTDVSFKSIELKAGPGDARDGYDGLWRTAALPEKDYCASLRK